MKNEDIEVVFTIGNEADNCGCDSETDECNCTTENLNVADAESESLSGDADTQQEINEEFVEAINNLVVGASGESKNLQISDPATESISGASTNQQEVNRELYTAVDQSITIGTNLQIKLEDLIKKGITTSSESAKVIISDPATESISGASTTQQEVNRELYTAVDQSITIGTNLQLKLEDLITKGVKANSESAKVTISDPATESISGASTTQQEVNRELYTAVDQSITIGTNLQLKLEDLITKGVKANSESAKVTLTDGATESIDGLAINQQEANVQFVNKFTTLDTSIKAIDTYQVNVKDPKTESVSGNAKTQQAVNKDFVKTLKDNSDANGLLQNQFNSLRTSNLSLDDSTKTIESLSGTAIHQSTVNIENVETFKNIFSEVDSLKTWIINHKPLLASIKDSISFNSEINTIQEKVAEFANFLNNNQQIIEELKASGELRNEINAIKAAGANLETDLASLVKKQSNDIAMLQLEIQTLKKNKKS